MPFKFRFIIFSIVALLIPTLIAIIYKEYVWFWWAAFVYGLWAVYELILKFKKSNVD